MGGSLGIALRLGTLLAAGSLLGGCVAQAAHAVFSPMLDAASESLQTPESVGISPATWRGKSCQELATSHGYLVEMQRETAAKGDAHMAKVDGWQIDALQQARSEQGCLNGNGTVAQAQPVAAAVAPSAPTEAPVVRDLGLTLQRPGPELVKALGLKANEGAWVVDVAPGSTAANAGIKAMDVILDVSGQVVDSPDDFLAITGKMRPGYQANLTVWRNHASRDVALAIPARSASPVAPASASVAAQPAPTSPAPLDARYCSAVVATQHTYGSTVSPVKLIPGAANDVASALRGYIAKVRQAQPGAWGELTLNSALCQPGAAFCSAEGTGPGGKKQNAFVFCHQTQAQADTQWAEMQKGDPQAVVVDWP